jgi:hypothetical protein
VRRTKDFAEMATKGGALRRFFLCLTGGFLDAAFKAGIRETV